MFYLANNSYIILINNNISNSYTDFDGGLNKINIIFIGIGYLEMYSNAKFKFNKIENSISKNCGGFYNNNIHLFIILNRYLLSLLSMPNFI